MTLGVMPHKSFEDDFHRLCLMLVQGENFAFSRFSDGEVFMMDNREIVMAGDHHVVKEQRHNQGFPKDDWKHFDPATCQKQREMLVEAFCHRQHNYFRGLSCRCCIGPDYFNWQLDILKQDYDGLDENHLTWSNLLINANYLRFLQKMVPLLRKKRIVMVVNEHATDFSQLEFNIVKDFRIGSNCIVNNIELPGQMVEWTMYNDIEDHVFLFAASSLSNMCIHALYRACPENTYIDIGSSLNPFMPGIGSRRNYMRQLAAGKVSYKPCIW